MNADCAFTIGSTHAVCQDYAVAINKPDRSHAIVSDGCSSSPHTDIGARLVVRAATQLLSTATQIAVTSLHEEASRQALKWAREIGLPDQSVDATLLTAQVLNNKLLIGVSGDGVVVLESTRGVFDVYSFSFLNGFPLYPAYQLQVERLQALQSNENAEKEIRHFQAPGPNGPFELVSTSSSSNVTESMELDATELKQVAIISDGIHSFYKTEIGTTSRHTVSMPLQHVLKDVIAFKGGHGTFVARRLKKLTKQGQLIGMHHSDDLAIGAIHLG